MNALPSTFASDETLDPLTAISLIGSPGSGKGTNNAKLMDVMQEHGKETTYFEVGAMVRRNIKQKTPFGLRLKEFSDAGKLVPNEIICSEIRSSIRSVFRPDSKLILDGFPRNEGQVRPYEELMEELEQHDAIVHLQLHPDMRIEHEIATERIIKRAEAAKKAGQEVRSDDTDPATIRKRLDEALQLGDVLDHFRETGKVISIDAAQPIMEVFAEMRKKVINRMLFAAPKKNVRHERRSRTSINS